MQRAQQPEPMGVAALLTGICALTVAGIALTLSRKRTYAVQAFDADQSVGNAYVRAAQTHFGSGNDSATDQVVTLTPRMARARIALIGATANVAVSGANGVIVLLPPAARMRVGDFYEIAQEMVAETAAESDPWVEVFEQVSTSTSDLDALEAAALASMADPTSFNFIGVWQYCNTAPYNGSYGFSSSVIRVEVVLRDGVKRWVAFGGGSETFGYGAYFGGSAAGAASTDGVAVVGSRAQL